jgi:hypothetical protein
MFARLMQLWRPEAVAFATPEVGRFFLGCRRCARVVPQYRCYGSQDEPGVGRCRCGNNTFSPMTIPEWRAALWVVWCYVWRKKIRGYEMWDARIALRNM